MARSESLWEPKYVCMKRKFKEAGLDRKCTCPDCTGLKKRMPRKDAIFFPEIIEKASEGTFGKGDR